MAPLLFCGVNIVPFSLGHLRDRLVPPFMQDETYSEAYASDTLHLARDHPSTTGPRWGEGGAVLSLMGQLKLVNRVDVM